jgi:hypothetical protein
MARKPNGEFGAVRVRESTVDGAYSLIIFNRFQVIDASNTCGVTVRPNDDLRR